MARKIITSSLVASILILFSGCGQKYDQIEFNKQIKKGLKESKNSDIIKNIKQIKLKDNFIDFSINKRLSGALDKLNQMNKYSVYILENTDNNIIFPNLTTDDSQKLHINSFKKLQAFISKTTPYVIKVKNNPFLRGIKIVKVYNKDSLKNNIKNYPFSIHSGVEISTLLNKISQITNYNIIFNKGNAPVSTGNSVNNSSDASPLPDGTIPDSASSNNTTTPSVNLNKKIMFKGKTIGELLNYLSNDLNYFVTIDYKHKLIIFNKYKTFTFPLILTNLESTTTAGLDKSSGQSSSNTNLQYSYTSQFISTFIKSLQGFVPDSKIVYDASGVIYAKTTKKDLNVISELIKNFNNQFLKEANIKVDIYAFLLSKKYVFGTDLSFKGNHINLITNYLAHNIVTATKNTGKISRTLGINSNNSFIKYVKHYSFQNMYINNMPQLIDLTSDRSYISSIKTTTTTSTASSTAVQTEIGHIIQGQSLILFPKIYSNKIMLRILFKNSTNDALEEKVVNKNTIMLPTISQRNIPINAVLRFGEKKVIGVFETLTDANQFQGIVPINDFVIGGTKNHQFVKEAIAIVISVKK